MRKVEENMTIKDNEEFIEIAESQQIYLVDALAKEVVSDMKKIMTPSTILLNDDFHDKMVEVNRKIEVLRQVHIKRRRANSIIEKNR